MPFDPDRYRPFIDDLGLSEIEALQLVTLVHDAMGKIVAAEFDQASRMKPCGQVSGVDTDLVAGAIQSGLNSLKKIYNEAAE